MNCEVTWLDIGGGAAILGLCVFVVRLYVKGFVERKFQKELITHKHNLETASRAVEHEFQRRLHDFGLYASKKHEVYAKLFSLFVIADGQIGGIIGMRRSLTFEEFSRDDIKKYMEGFKAPTGKIDEILELWEPDRKKAVSEWSTYERMLEIQHAWRKHGEAKNYRWTNSIYLSNETVELADKLLKALAELLVDSEFPRESGGLTKVSRMQKGIQPLLDELKAQMQVELYPYGEHQGPGSNEREMDGDLEPDPNQR